MSLNKLLLFGLVLTSFTREVFSLKIVGFTIDLFAYTFFFLVFCLSLIRQSKQNKLLTISFITISLASTFNYILFGFPLKSFISELLPIVIIYSSVYYIFKINDYNISYTFELYKKIAVYFALFGLVQYILSLIGIGVFIQKLGVLDSLAYEPSHYATIIMPAFLYTCLKKDYRNCVILGMSLLLTFSVTAYVVPVVFALFLNFKPQRILFVIILITISFLVYLQVDSVFQDKIVTAFAVLRGDEGLNMSTNLTVFSFYSNLKVAIESIKQNPFFGVGVGSHQYFYDQAADFYASVYDDRFGFNKGQAHNLAIRILSELGLVGFIAYCSLLYKSTKIKTVSLSLQFIAWSCVGHFLCKFLKLGGYLNYGTPFFLIILFIILTKRPSH